MRIVYITAGAAGMYCGSCIHDNTLAASLISKGHQVTLVPTYTPLRTDEVSVSLQSVFYGAVNVYLQEKVSLFRHTPRVVDWLLDRPALLNWVSRFSSSTRAEDLGSLTVSVLKGEEGHLKKELTKLVEWLRSQDKPDVVHLTNSMFLGLAKTISEQIQVPVVCSLQGEDIFLDEMIEPYREKAKSLIRENAVFVNGFVATNQTYGDFMSDYLDISRDKIYAVPIGINLNGHGLLARPSKKKVTTIGYLARICPEKGFHLLVEAFALLVQRMGKDHLRLESAGYLGPKDREYFEQVRARIASSGWQECYEHRGELDRDAKIRFLASLDVFSVPTVYKDPKGIFVLEALANGVPVVQPAHGNFPELISKTGGGCLVEPNSPEHLADGLELLVKNPEERNRLASIGRENVHRSFNADVLAENILSVYRSCIN